MLYSPWKSGSQGRVCSQGFLMPMALKYSLESYELGQPTREGRGQKPDGPAQVAVSLCISTLGLSNHFFPI